jgi:hypothetical protein
MPEHGHRPPVRSGWRQLNLNTLLILVGIASGIAGGIVGTGRITFVVTSAATTLSSRMDSFKDRLDAMERALDSVDGRLSRAEVAAAEAKASAEAMTREFRYKEELDAKRELRQTERRR